MYILYDNFCPPNTLQNAYLSDVDLLKYLMVKHVASFNLSCNKFLCRQGSVAIAECLRHHFTLMMQRGKNILKVIITSFINSMMANPETQICFSICPHNVYFEWGESLWRMHFVLIFWFQNQPACFCNEFCHSWLQSNITNSTTEVDDLNVLIAWGKMT